VGLHRGRRRRGGLRHAEADARGGEPQGLPPRHYPEWDQASESYRPDWVSLYEALHPAGEAAKIDRLLEKHAALARRLMRLLDLIKPQNKQRIRYQEEGSELDLDVAIRSLIDFRSGVTPDPRINMSHRTSGRSIAVLLLLDLSESLNQKVAGGEQTVLELVAGSGVPAGMAIERLNDPFAIAGFHSNTRHEVRYLHIKGFSERWDDTVKGRLAAALAPAGRRAWAPPCAMPATHLAQRQADKRLLLLLTDGEPADIDVRDPKHLHADARKAVGELAAQGVDTFCLSLDPKADDYVQGIFGDGAIWCWTGSSNCPRSCRCCIWRSQNKHQSSLIRSITNFEWPYLCIAPPYSLWLSSDWPHPRRGWGRRGNLWQFRLLPRGVNAMSAKHPVIAITGSSGRRHLHGQEVLRAHLPPRKHPLRGHRGRQLPQIRPRGDEESHPGIGEGRCLRAHQPLRPGSQPARDLEPCSAPTARAAPASAATTCTTPRRRALACEPGTFTPWEDLPPGTDCLFYEGLHGAVIDRGRWMSPATPTC
jgi:hypothetical protein